ncbi:uncharacterized protein LOC116853217 [Odontomachus brunneus]|uniref:uncharacterized protein LOC116853217 n=1 Tax=Odontomachus brunneus TaxID=486640 RepID=UPI0013F1B4C5|nr:uncharacterized protein LOC116853217 [Odontomachus brunneus]
MILHVAGTDNIVANALSRVEAIDMPTAISTADIAATQQGYKELQTLREQPSSLVLMGYAVDDSPHLLTCDTSVGVIRPYIPEALRHRIFHLTHNLAHPSGRATSRMIAKKFIWPRLDKDVTRWARACVPCQIGLPGGQRSYRSRTSQRKLLLTLSSRTGFRDMDHHAGSPRCITTDQGSQFEARLFNALRNAISCRRIRTSSYHPKSNGIIERRHRTLKAAIMCQQTHDWPNALPLMLLGLRTAYREELKGSVAELLYGTTLTVPGDFFLEPEMEVEPQVFIQKHREIMDLHSCTHVFLRDDRPRPPLTKPYEGPFEVIRRISDILFVIKLANGAELTVATEKLKPAYQLNETIEARQQKQTLNQSSRLRTDSGASEKRKVTFSTETEVQYFVTSIAQS